ncbi:hypothetical protein PLEOSDRAFT_165201 [Pleurotus ostreatus PC15]|uniref:Uncharacterized protein n=1 Tax=Pleurotus ostreatus (strain PC15) TaxID=1137138 RepID=A0A067NUN9_PLEO1|nr:hypothetical protein PLEOSDRAFT_1110030 [Pleurotus ostreatus PC15]KDQ31793.1 hypothetical protein PLEOSDRAFT_165201 [Pleurotus ostreatus PC15]
MKRAKRTKESEPFPQRPITPNDEPPKRKVPEAERMRMQVDDPVGLDVNGQRATKKLPKPRTRYRPYAPPNFDCLGPEVNQGIAATQHIRIVNATSTNGSLTTVRMEAQLRGCTSTPLPPELRAPNPHWGLIPEEAQMTATTIPFTTAALPKIAHKNSTALGNMREGLKKRLELTKDVSVLIIPFGAGNRFTRENPRYPDQVTAFLKSLKGAETSQIVVAPPSYQSTPPTRAHYAMPFAYVATNIPPGLKDFLIRRQTFAFQTDNKNHAFNAVEVPGNAPTSWVIANFAGANVSSDPDEMKAALEAIINNLFENPYIARETNRALAGKGVGGSVEERKIIALSTLSLSLIPRRNEHGEDTPVWQLAGRPIHKNHKDHRMWLKTIRQTTFELDNMRSLTSTAEIVGCVWCKAETHSSENCPFPKLKDWKGPSPDNGIFVRPEPPYRPDMNRRRARATKSDKRGKENR